MEKYMELSRMEHPLPVHIPLDVKMTGWGGGGGGKKNTEQKKMCTSPVHGLGRYSGLQGIQQINSKEALSDLQTFGVLVSIFKIYSILSNAA